MLINNLSKQIFWSYDDNADLPDEIVIKQVATYGEIKDLIKLSMLYPKETIIKVLQNFKNDKRVNFLMKVIL
jgi:hypothetical protein